MSVINNTSKPESVLKYRRNSVCYHIVCKSIAMGKSLTTCIDGNENPVNLLTKVLCGGKRRYLANYILYDVYNGKFKMYAVAE